MEKKQSSRLHFLSSRCYFSNFLSQVCNIVDDLEEAEQQILKDSRVWSIFHAPRVPQNIPLLYVLLTCYDAARDIFSIGSRELSFTPSDVALILGLPNQGEELIFLPKPYTSYTKTELKNQLLEMSRRSRKVEMKSIFLHLMSNFFFPSSGERIPQILLDLCEPMEFMRHNWPKAIHSFLMSNVKSVTEKLPPIPDRQIHHRPQESMGYVYGCTHILIIWFLEHTTSFPPVHPNSRPRLLRWSDKTSFNLKELLHTIPLMSDEQVIEEMEDLTAEELVICSDADEQPPSQKTKRKLLNPIPLRQKKMKLPCSTSQPTSLPPVSTAPSVPTPSSFVELLTTLEHRMIARFDDIEAYISKIDNKIDALSAHFDEYIHRLQPSASVPTSTPSASVFLEVITVKDSPYKKLKTSSEKEKVDDAYLEDYPGKMLLTEEQRDIIHSRMSSL